MARAIATPCPLCRGSGTAVLPVDRRVRRAMRKFLEAFDSWRRVYAGNIEIIEKVDPKEAA